jgi:hypothetical protein
MLYPKQTNCPENGDINFLIFSIDCRLSKLANTMYNNTVFMLNKTISSTAIFDLIQYKRILFYKQINPDYVACYSVNQIASQVKKLTAGFAGSSSSSFDPPATRTTTTTTSISTTTTTSSTTTTTTTIKVINCGTSSAFPGGVAYPTIQSITLGSVIGTVVLNYNTQGIPERFIVEWNNNVVIDTGYRGSNAYNFGEAARASFNSFLTGKTDPISGLQYPLTPGGSPPNQILADGYPSVSLPLAGTASFEKNLADSVSATVKVYSPVDSNIGWSYTLTCPVPTTTTTTSSTTTTTTTLPPEQFRIQASGVDQIGRLDNPAGIIISSSSVFKIIWGLGDEDTYGPGNNININHTYTSLYSGDIIIQAVDLTNITSLTIQSNLQSPGTLSVTTVELAKLDALQTFIADLPDSGQNPGIFVTGIVDQLPRSLITLNIANTNISGDTLLLPRNLTTCNITGSNTISGTVSNLPRAGLSTLSLIIRGANTISGDVISLPKATVNCIVTGGASLTGNTVNLPKPSGLLIINCTNSISGDVANLSKAVQVEIYGQNVISGDISGFTSSNTSTVLLVIQGSNEVTGNLSAFSSLTTLRRVEITGDSSFSGNLSSLPSLLTFVNLVPSLIGASGNTFSGSVSTLPAALEVLRVSSTGLFTGDLVFLPPDIIEFSVNMAMTLSYNLVTTRTWEVDLYNITLPPTSGGTGWLGFTVAETDKLLKETAPACKFFSSTANRYTILCEGSPPYTTGDPVVVAAKDTIEDELNLTIVFN